MKAECVFDNTESGIEQFTYWLREFSSKFSGADRLRAEVKEADTRSTDQNSLYFLWLDTLAKNFTKRGRPVSKDDMHDLMRHKFLGYEQKTIGQTKLNDQLKSTTKLNKSEMSEYMTKIEAWAIDCNVLLPIPADNEYQKYREAAL